MRLPHKKELSHSLSLSLDALFSFSRSHFRISFVVAAAASVCILSCLVGDVSTFKGLFIVKY